jgi:hypothetical protein
MFANSFGAMTGFVRPLVAGRTALRMFRMPVNLLMISSDNLQGILWRFAVGSDTMPPSLGGEIVDAALIVTHIAHFCPACRMGGQMLIEWPFWRCPHCGVRLIPADDPEPVAVACNSSATEISEHAA